MIDVETLVIGAGVTGLAAGLHSGGVVLERADGPGGICRSYYLRPGDTTLLDTQPGDGTAYRFEIGGGHWLFGGPPEVLKLLDAHADLRRYRRDATVRLEASGQTVPYPIQAHLDHLDDATRSRITAELSSLPGTGREFESLHDWLIGSFGPTLADLFFLPFNDRYTAGLTRRVAPQDDYKTPRSGSPGYNVEFRYPVGGLDALCRHLGDACDVRYGAEVVTIDASRRLVELADGRSFHYRRLLSTLPLDRAAALAGIDVGLPDPYTSVLVLNLGGRRGPACPRSHWQYETASRSGFHRIGFYSNVDSDFLPADRRATHVSMYVERAYPGGCRPDEAEVQHYVDAVARELIDRGYLTTVDVAHPSWVEVAYTWRRAGSTWRDRALEALDDAGVTQIGRYGRWIFQGIADSISEGLAAGAAAVQK